MLTFTKGIIEKTPFCILVGNDVTLRQFHYNIWFKRCNLVNIIPAVKSKLVMPQLLQTLVVSDRLQQLRFEVSRHRVVLILLLGGTEKLL